MCYMYNVYVILQDVYVMLQDSIPDIDDLENLEELLNAVKNKSKDLDLGIKNISLRVPIQNLDSILDDIDDAEDDVDDLDDFLEG